MAAGGRRPRDQIVGKLRAADPFELIRWLARSQPDPRKALAELVQNAIDAQARSIRITRLRERGVTGLRIVDDGDGVIPDLDREGALTYIATHVGHSRKRNLTPEQRRELMLQGKYGIGLLGFWAIGQALEMRTHVPGQPAHVLRLFEDSPRYEIERLRSRLPLDERATEIVVRDLHRPAFLSLTARRMADYLAAELRGQLLARDLRITVHDRIARGRAPKTIEVKPARFNGDRLDIPLEVPVPGHSPLRAELYLLPPGTPEPGHVAVSCAGTTVYDSVCELGVADFAHAPWSDPRLSGLIEFPDFQVAPGSRRGVVPDQAAQAFATALRGIEPRLRAELATLEARAAAAIGADLLKQLERAFRDVPRLAPEYDFFAVRAPATRGFAGDPAAAEEGARDSAQSTNGAGAVDGIAIPEDGGDAIAESEPPSLLPPGALAIVHVVPAATRVERLGVRRLRADARDASGTRIRRALDIRWEVSSGLGRVDPVDGAVTTFTAGPDTGRVTVKVTAAEGDTVAEGEGRIDITELGESPSGPRAGIPEPRFVEDPAGSWRSRMLTGCWEVNSGHADFRTAAETARRKLRYLAALLAKEVVLHSFPAPQLAPVLERLVEVLTITERRLERG